MSTTTFGVGQVDNKFTDAMSFHVNDPYFYKNRQINHTDRYGDDGPNRRKKDATLKGLLSKNESRNLYVYMTN